MSCIVALAFFPSIKKCFAHNNVDQTKRDLETIAKNKNHEDQVWAQGSLERVLQVPQPVLQVFLFLSKLAIS
jgi:hypothetical protein